jgi:hypothetical protein
MGLFLVQALKVGRTQREFNAAKPKLLEEVAIRIGAPGDGAAPTPKPRSRRSRRLAIGAGVTAVLIAVSSSGSGRRFAMSSIPTRRRPRPRRCVHRWSARRWRASGSPEALRPR